MADDDSDILKLADQEPAQSSNVVDQAVAKYPRLKSLNPAGLMSTNVEDNGNMLEHWSPGDMGTSKRPRPKELPADRVGIQVFNSKTTPDDIAGDIVSHRLVNTDPEIADTYQQFKKSLTAKQKEFLRGDYDEEVKATKNSGSDAPPPFDEWLDRVGAPAALRGYSFNQYSPKAQQEFGYTDKQKGHLDKIKNYATSSPQSGKEDDSDILKMADEAPQSKPGTSENPLAGFISKTVGAIQDYGKGEGQELSKDASSALRAAGAGAIKGIGEFATLPIGLLSAAAQHLNPEGLAQAIQAYPPLRRAVMLSRGQVTNPQYQQETQGYPYSEGTGAALGPMAVPMYDMAKAGQAIAPILAGISNPLVRKAVQTYIGALPLSGAVATQQEATLPNGSLQNGVLQTMAGAAVSAILSPLGGAGGNGKPKTPPNATPLEKELMTMPPPTAELPSIIKQTPVKVGEKYFDIKDPYERAAYEYYKKPTSKGGIRAKRWLDTNYPGQNYRNDGLAISKGLPILGEASSDATVTVEGGNAQEAARKAAEQALSDQIMKDRDKYEKEHEKAIKQKQQEQDKIWKEAEKQKKEQEKLQAQKDKEYGAAIDKAEKDKATAEAKADKLHEQVLAATDKETKAQLRKEETAAWKEYDEYDKALDKANDEYVKYKTSLQKEQAKQQKKEEALNQIYPQKLKETPIRQADVDWGDRQARLDAIRTYEKSIPVNKTNFTDQELNLIKEFGAHQRKVNDAEAQLIAAVMKEAEQLGISIKEINDAIVKPSVRTGIQLETGVVLSKGNSSLQATPFESATKLPELGLKDAMQNYLKAEAEYKVFRDSPIKAGQPSPVEILARKIKPGSYVEYNDTNIWHAEAPLTPTKGSTPETEAAYTTNQEQLAQAKLEDTLKMKGTNKTAAEKAAQLKKATRSKLAEIKGPKADIEHLQNVTNALEPKLGGTATKAMKSGIMQSSLPGLNELIDVASIIKSKLPKTGIDRGILEEEAQAKAMTIKNRNIYKRNDPELMQKLDILRAQANRFTMGVKSPQTNAEWEAWSAALRPNANEGELFDGEGIFDKLPQETRNYLLRLRVFREDALEAVKDSMVTHFGNSEGEIEKINPNIVNWQSSDRVRLYQALQTDIANFGGQSQNVAGAGTMKVTKNLQDAYLFGNQASHIEHASVGLMNNLAAHPIDTVRLIDQLITTPELRELLGEFDFGGAVRTNYTEQLGNEGIESASQNSGFQDMMEKIIPPEKWQQFKNVSQGTLVEKNFKLAITRAVGFSEAAKQLKMPLKDLSALLLRDAKGEQLTPDEEASVLFAHGVSAQYIEDTVGGSAPGMRDPNFLDHFPMTRVMTSFITSRQMQANFMNKSLAAAGDAIAAGNYAQGADYIRRAITLQGLQVMMNGAKGVGIGVGIASALGLKGDEKKALDNQLNRMAIIGNTTDNFIIPLQPQNFPVLESLLRSPGVIANALEATAKLKSLIVGKGRPESTNPETEDLRKSQAIKTTLRSIATVTAIAGLNKFADSSIGTQVALSAAFHAKDAMEGKKPEFHFGGPFNEYIGKEADVPTDAGKEVLQFLTHGESRHYMDLQSQLEDEHAAELKLKWLSSLSNLPGVGSAFQGYHDVYQDGLKKESAADRKTIEYMKKIGMNNNIPAHDIAPNYEGPTAFSWRDQLDAYEAPKATLLGKAIKFLNETSVDIK